MQANVFRRFCRAAGCGAIALLLAGAASPQSRGTSGRFSFDPVQHVPDLWLTYDIHGVQFQRASVAMVEAVVGKDNDYGFVGKDGREFSAPLDLKTLPFWVYAEYVDRATQGRCRYVLIDGLLPDADKPLAAGGDIDVGIAQQVPAVLRDCGQGFEIVSREVYDSLFDASFESAYLKGKGRPPVGAGVAQGLARDYVRRLIVAFGGRDALKRQFAQTPGSLDHLEDALEAALAEAGVIRAVQPGGPSGLAR